MSTKIHRLLSVVVLAGSIILALPGSAQARADVVDLFMDALMENDASQLDGLLASNFVFIGTNGHIQDKSHFLATLKSGKIKIYSARFKNMRESSTGPVRVLTGNGEFTARSEVVLPSGLMRITVVTDRAKKQERLVLVQLTPVIPTDECKDGNCLIR